MASAESMGIVARKGARGKVIEEKRLLTKHGVCDIIRTNVLLLLISSASQECAEEVHHAPSLVGHAS